MITTKKGISKPSWLLLVPANCLLSTVIAATYGYPKENHKNIAFYFNDTPVFASASASTSATSTLVPPVTATVSDDATDNAFDSEAAGSGTMGIAKAGQFYTAGPTPTGSLYSATSYDATTGQAQPTHSAVSSSSPLPPVQHVVRQVTGVGDFPQTYDNHKRLYVDFQYSDILHEREVIDVSPNISDLPSACHYNPEQLSVNLQNLEVVQEVTDGSHDLKHLPQLHDNLEQPSVDTQDRGFSPVVGDLADAFIDIPKATKTNTDDSKAFNGSEPHQGRMESTEEPYMDEHASPVGSFMDDAEKRRRIVLSSQSSPVINRVFGPFKGLALDFGINWLPKNWNPYNDPPMLGHIVEEWNRLISEQKRQNAETDINNKILRGNVQSVGITLNDFKRKMKVFRLTETRSQERDDRANERETELDAREAETAKTKQEAEALLETANEAVRQVKQRSLHKALRDVSRGHFSQLTDSRSTAVSVPQPTPFWRVLKAQPYCPVPESPLAIRTAQTVCQLWGRTQAWLRSVDWRSVGEGMWRWLVNAGHRVSTLLYHLCWFFVLYVCRSKIEKSFVSPPGPPRFPGDLPDLDDLEDDRHRRQSSNSHYQQFVTPHARLGDVEPRRRGRYGLVSRSPSPENLEVILSRPVTPTQLIPESTSGLANGIRSVFDEQRGRLVERAPSLRRSRSSSPSMILSRSEDRVRPTIATPSPPVPIEPATDSEPEGRSLHVSSTSDVVNDAIVSLLRPDLVTSSVLDTHSPSVQLDAVEADPSAQVVPQAAAEDTEIVVALVQRDTSVATVSYNTAPCSSEPPVPESATDNVEIVLQPQPDASGGTTVTNEVLNNAQNLHEEDVEVSAPQQPLDHTAATFDHVNDAADGLQPGLAVDSVFDTPGVHPEAGDAVTSEPPAVQMLVRMATEDTEIMLPVQQEACISSVSCKPSPCNVGLSVSESAIQGVESRPAPETYASGQTTAVSPVSNTTQASQEEEKDAVEVSARLRQAPPTMKSVAPSDSTVNFERRAIPAPARSMPSQQQLHTPSKQIKASFRRVAFSPEPSVTIIPHDEGKDDLATVGQAIVIPDPVVVERKAETPEAPASPVVAMETVPNLVKDAPLSAAFVAQLQTALLTAMHVDDGPAPFLLSELPSVLTEIKNESIVTAMDVEQSARSAASVDQAIAPTDLIVVERVGETLEAPVLPVRSTSLVFSMETQLALTENVPQAVNLAELQSPMDVEDLEVAETHPELSTAMDIEDEHAPFLLGELFSALTEIESERIVIEEVHLASHEMMDVKKEGVTVGTDAVNREAEDAMDATMVGEAEDTTLKVENVMLKLELEDATLEMENANTGIDDMMGETSASDGPFMDRTDIEMDSSLQEPEQPGHASSNDARPSESTARPSTVLHYPPFIPPVPKLSVFSAPQHLLSVTNFPMFKLPAPLPARVSTWTGNSGVEFNCEGKASPSPQARTDTTESCFSITTVPKKVRKLDHLNIVEGSPASQLLAPSLPAVGPAASLRNTAQPFSLQVTAQLSAIEEEKPWEMNKVQTEELLESLTKEATDSANSVTDSATPVVTVGNPTETSPVLRRRINSDGRMTSVPVQSRWKPTKPKAKITEPAISLLTTSTASAPASSDIANEQSVTANVPAPKGKTYLPWEYEKASTKVVMDILGEQLAAEAQIYGQLYRPLGTAWPASSTTEVPVRQQVADNAAGEPMTMNENMPANVALQQAQTLRRPVGPEQPSSIANQQNLEALTTNLPLNVPPPATTDAFPVFSNAHESQVVDDDNGSMNGNAPPADLDARTDENAVNDHFNILAALSDVNVVPHTDNRAEGGPDPGYESMSDVDLENADNLWSLEDGYRT
ncbi:hypothetical protein QFC22_006455 [Naganishia vaughanmartiniae]|uniref:Uncharacterized protein n=1 Tax=Naganishia vaughanmartiniae TaxID=1424756 RepID=A0ACC2WL26_9TREE|nr:hypothetical protein QFC22_006455 [Naganishia vaughanmartiniae]